MPVLVLVALIALIVLAALVIKSAAAILVKALLLLLIAFILAMVIRYGLRLWHFSKLLKALADLSAGLTLGQTGSLSQEALELVLGGLTGFLGEWCKRELSQSDARQLTDLIEKIKQLYDGAKGTIPDAHKEKIEELMRRLLEIFEELKRKLGDLGDIKKGTDLSGAPPSDPDAEKIRDEAWRRARDLVRQYRKGDPKIHDFLDQVEKFRDTYENRPEDVIPIPGSGSASEDDPCRQLGGYISSLVFGNGSGIQLQPGCCINIRFSPKLKDNWNDPDLFITTSPAGAGISVSGLPKGRDVGKPSASWEPISGSGGSYEFSGLWSQYRSIRICNTGSQAITIQSVRGNN